VRELAAHVFEAALADDLRRDEVLELRGLGTGFGAQMDQFLRTAEVPSWLAATSAMK
jgi:hypothetical protein